MKEPQDAGDELWDRGWAEHQTRQLRRLAKLPFVQKLEWLEEAQDFGESLIARSRRITSSEERE